MSTEELKEHLWRIQDFWGRHNLSSRLLVLTMVGVMIALTTGLLLGIEIPASIFETAFWAFAAVIIVYAIGPGALEKTAAVVSQLKTFK